MKMELRSFSHNLRYSEDTRGFHRVVLAQQYIWASEYTSKAMSKEGNGIDLLSTAKERIDKSYNLVMLLAKTGLYFSKAEKRCGLQGVVRP